MGCGNSKSSDPINESVTRNLVDDNTSISRERDGWNRRCVKLEDEKTQRNKIGEEMVNYTSEVNAVDCKLEIDDKNKIKQAVDCLKPGELFHDLDFPANDTALYYSDHQESADIKWLRPKDIVKEGKHPHMLVDGISRDDIKQGILGDCWFLSSCAAVSQQEKFMRRIIPDQSLYGDDYKGMVRFRFWRFGEWIDVYIDDRLPVRDGELIYAQCDDPTEFWVALIEKAYAKLHGSYEAIEGGQTMDALVDLTGGLAERYELKGADPNMYRHLRIAHKSGAFIACTRKGDWRLATKADENGLVSGHAYTITNVVKIQHKMGEEKLIRIRNPWGNETEWKGSWSDEDSNWDWVDEDTKSMMQMESKPDGEFWMSFKEFCRQFAEVTICTLGPDFDGDGEADHAGHMELITGEWIQHVSSGGSRNDLEKFATNPQYILTLLEPDDFDPMSDDPETEGKCSVVIALMQEHRRSSKNSKVKALQIGFILYQTDSVNRKLPAKHFKYNYEAGKSGVYINLREVSGRFELDPGHYAIIPSTFKHNDPGKFMLRVFAQKKFTITGPL